MSEWSRGSEEQFDRGEAGFAAGGPKLDRHIVLIDADRLLHGQRAELRLFDHQYRRGRTVGFEPGAGIRTIHLIYSGGEYVEVE